MIKLTNGQASKLREVCAMAALSDGCQTERNTLKKYVAVDIRVFWLDSTIILSVTVFIFKMGLVIGTSI